SGTPGGSSGGSTGPVSTTAPTTATVTSTDGKASLAGTDTAGAGLLAVAAQGTTPAGWTFAGNAYAVTPANRTFDPAVVLSFTLPSAGATATIARLDNGAWSPVPSKVEGDRITAEISRAGSYALLVPAEAPTATTIPATTTAAPVTTTPTAAPLTALLPVIAFATLMLERKRRG
ncbi:MAG TPA: hypothetical protein PK739_09635, partial [Methanoculleus sp.]|nr:hypothetical protein [Methanoculleus sp.]